MKADGFLQKSLDILTARGKEYDKPDGERSMGKCVAAFNIITGRDLTEAEGWLLLQVLKDVRQWTTPKYHADSAEDCVTYAALKGEALSADTDKEAAILERARVQAGVFAVEVGRQPTEATGK